jgi:mannose-6-phosphate isomerase-like protein (cupin superfamily)
MMNIEKVNVADKLTSFKEYWSPKIVGELNQQLVKVAKFKGDFVMHQHENEDELFYVITGSLYIELENKTLVLQAGEFAVIPKGVPHKPYAPEEVHVMLFEPAATLNTGNLINDRTVTDIDRI